MHRNGIIFQTGIHCATLELKTAHNTSSTSDLNGQGPATNQTRDMSTSNRAYDVDHNDKKVENHVNQGVIEMKDKNSQETSPWSTSTTTVKRNTS